MLAISDTIDLVIFDCDGVLVDSEVISAEVLVVELSSLGLDIDIEYILRHFLGLSFTSTERALQRDFGIQLPTSFKAKYDTTLLHEFERRLKATQGLDKVLCELNVDICVATSSSPKRVKHALKLTHLDNYFGMNVFTSSEVKSGKPAPDLFLHAARQMSVAPDRCLVIEDSPAGIIAGMAAGMSVLHYKGASHLSMLDDILATKFSDIAALDDWQNFYNMASHLSKRDSFLE